MLGVVGTRDILAQLHGAPRGGLVSGDELHQRGLARAIGTYQHHVVSAVELQRDALVYEVVPVGLAHVVQRHHHVARTRRLGETEVHLLGLLGKHHELVLDLLQTLDALLHLLGLRRLVAEAVDERLHVLDVALLRRALGLELLQVVLALLEVARVVAGVRGEASVLERRHVAHARVHEGAVMAHDEHGAVIRGQERLQPPDALEVQVVGGLVQKQQVRVP